jgi:hypothetical protein
MVNYNNDSRRLPVVKLQTVHNLFQMWIVLFAFVRTQRA